jgi:hypothetical protein
VDPLSAVDHAITLVKRLRDISKNVAEAEFKNVLADLLSELADAKVEIAALKGQVAEQTDEIRALKTAAPEGKVKPTVKWGCYQFEGDEGLYCTACYDSRGVKSLTSRDPAKVRFRRCPVCHALLGG